VLETFPFVGALKVTFVTLPVKVKVLVPITVPPTETVTVVDSGPVVGFVTAIVKYFFVLLELSVK